MDVLRTADERFVQLEDHAFDPRYLEVTAADGTRPRFQLIDEGSGDAAPVLPPHGNQGANP